MTDYEAMIAALIEGDEDTLTGLVRSALDLGADANDILARGLIRGMDVVGDKMESEELFIPEVLRSARCMSAAVEILKPMLSAEAAGGAGRIALGTVKGDLHDIGKNLVKLMLESAGFEIVDLGVDAAPDAFVKAVSEKNVRIVGLSALLTTTMPMMKKTIDALRAAGVRDRVKVMVGGAPVTQRFADEIGSDGYAADAGGAVKLAKRLARG